jgi:hypothetical protein
MVERFNQKLEEVFPAFVANRKGYVSVEARRAISMPF